MSESPEPVDSPEFREALRSCLGVERFVDEVAAAAPFGSRAELLETASRVARTLTPAEVDAALAHHPRIGERASGEGRAQRFSRSEQSAADASDSELAAAIAAGNAAYEERFDRVFLIRAAGRGRPEILAELTRRLELDDATEAATVASELHDITLLRLGSLYPDGDDTAESPASDASEGAA
ncbi:2-oxo-4-hydroxy-4-carboxy-5-ureidoimidazoline decarboxylase [Herbiconiux moechotypicola]|uniref:2-oxo-4-hydroxy-4-carboxy-5-ureidoimidazoline decarboxylase n=1 Tax=Herbiconiux moechotypicola TaxID=637393 RepID=A0ABP5R1K8_9MICO|nr:2-oxo-4-hydroxy-4-carboxy-5-ureidoimidazoline decarboxylase [Herbiconiux moechotypicola]MCS5731922.1 2-oxo-4-hydroxy-4-carboxy-5-ureidoimidazoline decarboxylase [Herbiconiux moechotypicola]